MRLLCMSVLAAPLAWAAPAHADVILSEYVEGSSNNKAIELLNRGPDAVDLAADGYAIEIFFNGATSPQTTLALDGTIAPGDVFVVASARADAEVLAVADQTATQSLFNGDDAVVRSIEAAVLRSSPLPRPPLPSLFERNLEVVFNPEV